MFSDPLSITYNSSAKSLPVVAPIGVPRETELFSRAYSTADGEFRVRSSQSVGADGSRTVNFRLTRVIPDTDVWEGVPAEFSNSVAVSVTSNVIGYGSSTDVPLLLSALSTFVSTNIARVLGGEI